MATIPSSRLRLLATIFFSLCFLFSSVLAQFRYDDVRMEHFNLREPIHRFVLPAPIVKYFAFGFQNALADYYWVTAVQDFNKWDRQDFYYPEYFRIIATLDKKFEYPYIFAALTVPSRLNKESLSWLSIIAEQGMFALPESWQIPFDVGLQYHTIGKSYERATHYLAIAAGEKSSPEVTREVYGLFLLHSSTDYQKSRALFTAIYETTDNEETKKIAKERIILLNFIETIDEASVSYKAVFHVFPNSIDQLASTGFIKIPPELIKRFPVDIDPVKGRATLR